MSGRAVKDPKRNGGRELPALVHHMTTDALVQWAWNPGVRDARVAHEAVRVPSAHAGREGGIFDLNAARVYGIDPNAHRNPVPPDYVARLRAAYLEEGPRPSLTQYGWVLDG